MYVPLHAREERIAVLHDAMRNIAFGTLVTSGANGPLLTHLPMMVVADDAYGTIVGHVARANGQWQKPLDAHGVASFVGPSFYVSPNYYATKAATGKVVPTWNYIAVEARGSLEFFDGHDRLLRLVEQLTDHHEASQPRPWAVDDAPEQFIEGQLRGIVGFELRIGELAGAWKLNRNKGAADRCGVADAIAGSELPALRELSALVRLGATEGRRDRARDEVL